MKNYILTGQGTVSCSWIDDNEHMNVIWYTHLVDLATRALLKTMAITEHGSAPNFVAARVTTAHRKELRLAAPWETWSGLSEVTERLLVCTHKVMSKGSVAARSEIAIVPFDQNKRCASRFLPSEISKARAYLIEGLTPFVVK